MSERVTFELPDALVEQIVAAVTERVLTELRRDQARRWLPAKEAAAELGMTPEALRRHAARGHVTTVKVGRRVLVDMEALRS